MNSTRQAIVIDNGSGVFKAGFAGCKQPSVIFPNIVAHRRLGIVEAEVNLKERYIGYDALANKKLLTIRYPIERGIVTNWDDMEMIWQHTFYNELQIAPEEHPILLTEVPLNPIGNRQMMAQVLFEQFHVPAMCVAIDSVLAFFASGRTEGIVLECGDGVSYAMPIYQANIMSHEIQRLDLAGRDLTCYMAKLLAQRGHSFTTTGEQEIVRDIKERVTYASLEFEKETEKCYELPDGQKIILGDEGFRCTEALFQPTLIGENNIGIAQLLYTTISNCDIHIQDRLYRHIYLSGGTTMIPGLPDRLQNEMKKLSSSTSRIRFLVQPDRSHAVWIGGSILASFPAFQKAYISKLDYNEYGPSIIHRTCCF